MKKKKKLPDNTEENSAPEINPEEISEPNDRLIEQADIGNEDENIIPPDDRNIEEEEE